MENILTIDDVAEFLQVSKSWVYQNYHHIGGVKLGNKEKGLIRFPSREEIYGRLFHKGEGVAVPLQVQQDQIYEGMVPNKKGRPAGGNAQKGRNKKEDAADIDPAAAGTERDPFNLLGTN
jgi:hypothetical protein